jgi:hypothetical protein
MTLDETTYSEPWFAWHPVITECGSWAWLTWLRIEVNNNPIHWGLPPVVKYHRL